MTTKGKRLPDADSYYRGSQWLFARRRTARAIALGLYWYWRIESYAYYFDSGDSNSVREMGFFCAEIPRNV
jgi:hypothetical protein